MVDQSKPKYLPTINLGLDANSASWTLNNSIAISLFESMMKSTNPKRKYMIGPYFFARFAKATCGHLLKYNKDPTMGHLGGPGGKDVFKFGMNHVRYNIKLTTTTTSNQKSTTSNSMFELKTLWKST
jgi:hypothetical protein